MKPETDRIFRNSICLIENKRYHIAAQAVSAAVTRRAAMVSAQITAMAHRGKLDAIDLEIISLRSLSPMPTYREISHAVNMSKQAVHKRTEKIKNTIETSLSRENRLTSITYR